MGELRWRLADEERDGQQALFGVDGLTSPQRGTGRLSGLEFLHVAAKQILNPVPASSRMPFRWTINVYRGCSHACAYCLGGDTPILMADGRVKPLAEVRVGDHVYGTQRQGDYRRYVPTPVLAHWQTTKQAYRIVLEDGTTLIASADHRFLTRRGWKHVTAAGDDGAQRPHLTTNNVLLGIGHLAKPPNDDADYRLGYLTGMIRGDANLATYDYNRAGGQDGTVRRFRLALADGEPLDRAHDFLQTLGIATRSFDLSPASDTRHAMTAIRTSAESSVNAVNAVDAVRTLIRWPRAPSDQWRKGFLSGIFDAEGSHSGGILRISNSDPSVINVTSCALNRFGFDPVVEPAGVNSVRTLRIRGGLRERMRFFVTVDPATTRKRTIDAVALRSDARLRVISIEPVGLELPMFDITTGTGDFIADGVVSHNCFARPTHEYLGLNLGEDFDRKIVVKVNAVDKLRAELAAPTWTGEPVAMGTNTDPYQRAEGKYRLTRGVVEALAEHRNPFSILTKSALVTRDLDLLVEASRHSDITVNFSVPTVDESVWRATEPGTPHPRRRLDALRELAAAGIRTGVLVGPILPGLSDRPDQIDDVVHAIHDAGGRVLGAMALHLRPGTREHFLAWLAGYDPVLHANYLRRYAGSDYAPTRYTERLRAMVADAERRSTLPVAARPG